ncbi:MAG: AAA family ATPase [Firmicutes bacterium]|nr:AAA family ATPase [Bacillota bacterium]
MDKIKVIILDNNLEERFDIENALANIDYIEIARTPDDLEEAIAIIESDFVDVILVSNSFNGGGYEIAENLSTEFIDKATIILEKEINEDTMYQAIFSGAKDVILLPVKPNKLVDSIYKANKLTKKRLEHHRKVDITKKKKSGYGQVYSVFSTKGGTGKTFFATNLAITLLKETNKKVCLLDFDLDYGNISLALDIVPKFTIIDVIDDIKSIDPDYIETFLTNHESGLKVLAASKEANVNDFINTEHIQIIIKTLQSAYDYIIIDMSSRFTETTNPAFVFSEKLFLITTPEIMSVKNIKGAITTLTDFNYPKNKINIVLNKFSKNSDIRSNDIEKILGFDIFYKVPDDYLKVMASLNQGIPYVQKYPRSEIGKSFSNIVSNIVGEEK